MAIRSGTKHRTANYAETRKYRRQYTKCRKHADCRVMPSNIHNRNGRIRKVKVTTGV